ncbi:Ankryin repeat protein (Fragment) [Madurella fahalii]|uniref:Ankryin repeat protein n=1 Tax=Madurella fahalii TaxID=1157608 RepID=A0ABQ0GFM8_9PEZI
MSDTQRYTVGWICALTTEFVAARAFLDEEHDGPCQVAQHDNNCYVLGKIGRHNVVIAVLPDAEYGIASAAAVARDMLHSFPNVRIGLMVGIGGGAPSQKHDIRLGDVVVSRPDSGKGGVLQYDFGKTIQNQLFQETGFLDQPPTILRAAIASLRGTYEMKGHRLVEDVDKALKKIKKRKKYIRPPAASDRLYKSHIIHPLHSPDDCTVVCGSDEAHMVVRDARDEEDDDLAIHYGLIASGNQLMKDARIRDKLANDKDVLCFEMETAGLMNHFPCLVIRGICDYSDSHKNKEWQGFAAMMAAAYAKDLLRQMLPNKVEEERRIDEVLNSVQENLERLHQTVNDTKTTVMAMEWNGRLPQIERWLHPPDASTNFNHARKQWHEGSGLWFLNSPAFNGWKRGSYRRLWLYGLAGCGKTILSTTIVDHLRKMNDCITLEFYFDFNDTVKQNMDGVIRSLIFQLYKLGSHLKDLESLYQSYLDGHRQPDTKTLSNCLYAMIKASGATYIIMDALDECTERRELLGWMKEFFTKPGLSHVHLIATSRPEEEFLSFIPSWIGKEHCLQLDKDSVNADIRFYVTARLEHSSDFVNKGLSQDLVEQIRNKVGDGADGMFRWAVCQLTSLATCMSSRAIEKALETLPPDLNATYHRMLRSIPADIQTDAICLLQFLVHAKRPLTLSEAVEVIATQTDEEPRGFDPKRRLFREADILRHCPNLVSVVEVLKYGTTVKELHLAHFSIKEYLLRQDYFDLTSASIVITKTCLSYLTDIEYDSWKAAGSSPMAGYAANYWMNHAASAETSEDVVRRTIDFFHDESAFQRWAQLYENYWVNDLIYGSGGSRLYFASQGGLVAAAIVLLEAGADINAQGGVYGNALQAASNRGHKEIVQLLLDKGADVNAQSGFLGNALYAASDRGYKEIVQLLLDKGADINAQGGVYGNALYAASAGGHKEIVQLLLD